LDVFQVETIGDCYVAVAGLPHPRDDHAVVMATFCKECMERMMFLVHHLEVTLGPDTGDLSMRFGLHSGPVTAGVLRGEKSRFQLFGDSVNTAARIETTGARGKIHMSHETAELLISAGHSKWVAPRRDLVTAKGKGVLRTYWLVTGEESEGANRGEDALRSADLSLDKEEPSRQSSSDLVGLLQEETEKANTWGNTALAARSANRLIDWNVDVLRTLLKNVVRKRRNEEKNR
jgi:Adenylate and Guanylate cyclase catalytic domain